MQKVDGRGRQHKWPAQEACTRMVSRGREMKWQCGVLCEGGLCRTRLHPVAR